MCFRGVIVCEKLDPLAENRVRAYIASLHRLTLAVQEVLLAARVLLFPFGRDARKHDSPWRVGFCLKLFFFTSNHSRRGRGYSRRDCLGSDSGCSLRELLYAMNSFLQLRKPVLMLVATVNP